MSFAIALDDPSGTADMCKECHQCRHECNRTHGTEQHRHSKSSTKIPWVDDARNGSEFFNQHKGHFMSHWSEKKELFQLFVTPWNGVYMLCTKRGKLLNTFPSRYVEGTCYRSAMRPRRLLCCMVNLQSNITAAFRGDSINLCLGRPTKRSGHCRAH